MAAAVLEPPAIQPLEPSAQARMVSLRRVKAIAARMGPAHPIRVLLLAEPDELPWEEYATKSEMWFRLLTLKVD